MVKKGDRTVILLFLTAIGFAMAGFAGLSEHVDWIGSFCGYFTGNCGEASRFTFFRVSVWAWGMGFYILFAFFILNNRQWPYRLLTAGIGMEFSLVYIMITTKTICFFCLVNLLVVFFLGMFSYKNLLSWKMLSFCLIMFILSLFILSRENGPFVSPPGLDKDGIVAVVSGTPITHAQLERPLATKIYNLQLDIYRLKKQQLDEIISEDILLKECEARGISKQQLIDNFILSDGVDVSDDEVRRYYRQNRNQFDQWINTGEPLGIRIKSYLIQQKSNRKIMDFTQSLYPKYGVTVNLKEPPLPLTEVSIENNETWGSSQAPVTVVEFSDYLCPACRKAHETVKKIREMYPVQLKWVFKDYPLEKHRGADLAAEAARCAGEQDKFWEYQNLLYESKEPMTATQFEVYASRLGLDGGRFSRCLDSGKFKEDVNRDIEDAKKAGVDRTPSFLINGKLTIGSPSFEKFKMLIDREIGQPPGH